MIYLLTGGSGNVGTRIKQDLLSKGFEVRNLTRNPKQPTDFKWDIKKSYIDPKAFDGVNIIIHLAGAGIADHVWTESYKKEIYDSRIDSTKLLHNEIEKLENKPSRFISTSAIGYYTEPAFNVDESSPAGHDFMSKVCQDWEGEALKIKELGVAVSIVRTGIVLQNEGGFFPVANKTSILKLFPTVGSALHYLSWIHINDLSSLYQHMSVCKGEGIVNGCVPHPPNQKEFMQGLAKAHGGIGLHPNIPAVVLKLAMGERSVLALSNKQVFPTNTLKLGFEFDFADLQAALKDLLK
jgi:hypothetical protein